VTTQRQIAERLGLPVHPPKVEVFDLDAGTNTDPKQIVRPVERFRVEPFGLYLTRPMPGHPRLRSLESWLLPEQRLRITRWECHPGHSPQSDFYLDIAAVESGATRWRTVDHYLDVLLDEGSRAELVDVDEYLQAVRSGLLDERAAEGAMQAACAAVDGLARHGYRLADWLGAQGIELSWRGRPADDR